MSPPCQSWLGWDTRMFMGAAITLAMPNWQRFLVQSDEIGAQLDDNLKVTRPIVTSCHMLLASLLHFILFSHLVAAPHLFAHRPWVSINVGLDGLRTKSR